MYRMQTAGMRKRWLFHHTPPYPTCPHTTPSPTTAAASTSSSTTGKSISTHADETGDYRSDSAVTLSKSLRVHPLIGHLLIKRCLMNLHDAEQFLKPKLTYLHEPGELPGVLPAAERLVQAVQDHRPIVIYGDYDVDGVTGSAVLWHVLKAAGVHATVYIPHRLDEGYGLNCEAVRELSKRFDDASPLIVTVDCGITAVDEAKLAKELGIELIITDHHAFNNDTLPEAAVLVHPSFTDGCTRPYPFTHLCGAAVAFKLAWQFARLYCRSERLPEDFRDLFMDLLSLVALGTVADIVPLHCENRILTVHGLGRIKHTRFVGLNALIDAAHLRDEKIDAYHVGFVLGPRLNACGRMGHAARAVHLLTEATQAEANETADFLTRENDRRRRTELEIFKQARQMVLEAGYNQNHCRAIVLGSEGWHQGVIGIVASRLVEAFNRPVVMLNYNNGMAQGSARSVEGVSIYEALQRCESYLDHYGGHDMAAGLTLRSDQVDAFREQLVKYINTRLGADDLTGVIRIDARIELEECQTQLFEQIQKLAPFGKGNPSPRLLLERVILDRPAMRMGSTGRHLSLMLRQNNRLMRAVAFGMGDLAEKLPAGTALDVVFKPKLSMWQGVKHCDLVVEDLRYCEG